MHQEGLLRLLACLQPVMIHHADLAQVRLSGNIYARLSFGVDHHHLIQLKAVTHAQGPAIQVKQHIAALAKGILT